MHARLLLLVLLALSALPRCGLAQATAEPLAAAFALNITREIEGTLPGEGASYAGVGFDGTHLWVTRWNSPRVVRLTLDGKFFDSFEIPGLSEIRSLAWDGSHFWASNNSTTLHRIDPVSRSVVATLEVANPARYAAFDPEADTGAGGLWVGNFSTDLTLVGLDGEILATLPAAGLAYTVRYGLAWEDAFAAEPVLRVFDQGGSHAVDVGTLTLPAGTGGPTTDMFPALTAFGTTAALAGGLSFAPHHPGGPVLLALAQSVPDNVLLGLVPAASLAVFGDGFESDAP